MGSGDGDLHDAVRVGSLQDIANLHLADDDLEHLELDGFCVDPSKIFEVVASVCEEN